MAKTETRKAPTTKVLSVAEIERLYPHEWVVMEITRDARRHESVRGRLIAHSPDRDGVVPDHIRFREDHPGVMTFVFYTTPDEPHEGWSAVL